MGMGDMMQVIIAAAIKAGKMVCFVPRPGRHADVMREMAKSGHKIPIGGEQGFVTNEGRFVNREAARKIANDADQIIASRIGPDGVPYKFQHRELFSEDVW